LQHLARIRRKQLIRLSLDVAWASSSTAAQQHSSTKNISMPVKYPSQFHDMEKEVAKPHKTT